MSNSGKIRRSHVWFFCWIEIVVPGKIKGENVVEYLFMTVNNAFGKSERELPLLTGFYNNKMLGYDAIRKHFVLRSDEGVEKRCKVFWETKNILDGKGVEITEITTKIKDFYPNFGKFLEKGYFLNEQLADIIQFGPENLKSIAWNQLMLQNMSTSERSRFLRLLGDLLEYWFVRRNDPTSITKAEEVWRERIGKMILDLRFAQVREIYNYIYSSIIHSGSAHKYFYVSLNNWDGPFLETVLKKDESRPNSKSKLEMMINYFYGVGHQGVAFLDEGIVLVKDMWDLFVIEKIFDRFHSFHEQSILISKFFTTVASMLKRQ